MIFDKLQKISTREKRVLVVASCLVLALAVDWSLKPIFGRWGSLDAEIENAENELAYNRSVLSRRALVQQDYDSVCGLLAKASLAAEDIDEMKGEIEAIATETGLQYDSMSHSEPKKLEFYDEYIVEIGKYQCDMKNVLMFLHAMNKTPGLLRVSRMNVKSIKGENSKVTGSISISKVMISNDGGSSEENNTEAPAE